MLDLRVIAYLRKNPDLLSDVIDRLLTGEEFDPLVTFAGSDKRKWGEAIEYDDRGRPKKKYRPNGPPDLWNAVLGPELRYAVMSSVLDLVRNDESSFIDLFILSLVSEGMRVDVLSRVKELEMQIDVVPLYCRAAFIYYKDDETLELFLNRLDSCAPVTSSGWKKLLSPAYVDKVDDLFERVGDDESLFQRALLNNAIDPIAAILIMNTYAPGISLFSFGDINKLKRCVFDTDLLYMSMTHRNGLQIVDPLRALYYCVRGMESGFERPEPPSIDEKVTALGLTAGSLLIQRDGPLNVLILDGIPLVDTIFDLLDDLRPRELIPRFVEAYCAAPTLRKPGEHQGLAYYLMRAWALKYLSDGTKEALDSTISQLSIPRWHAPREIAVVAAAAAIAKTKDIDFAALTVHLTDQVDEVIGDYYLFAALYGNEALLDFLIRTLPPLNHRIAPYWWLQVMTHEFLDAVNNNEETQLRFFRKLLPADMDNLKFIRVFNQINVVAIIGQPLYKFLLDIWDAVGKHISDNVPKGNILFRLRSCKTREDTIRTLDIGSPLKTNHALLAFNLVSTSHASRKDSEIVADVVYQHVDPKRGPVVDALVNALTLIPLSPLPSNVNMKMVWKWLLAPKVIAPFLHVKVAEVCKRSPAEIKEVLMFVEKMNDVVRDEDISLVKTAMHAFMSLFLRENLTSSVVYNVLNLTLRMMRASSSDEQLHLMSAITASNNLRPLLPYFGDLSHLAASPLNDAKIIYFKRLVELLSV